MKRKNSAVLVGVLASFMMLSLSKSADAQSYYYQFGSYPWSIPLPVTGGYIDAANGNLHLAIPIASIPQRGHVAFAAELSYDSHIWEQVTSNGSTSWQPTNVPSLPTTWGGWRLVSTAGTGTTVSYKILDTQCLTSSGGKKIPHHYTVYENFTWTTPDGHTIPFGGSTVAATNNPCQNSIPNYSGIAADASGYHISVTSYTSSVVFAPDGTQIFPNVKDTNGNYYSAPNGNGDVTDTVGRTPITTTVVNGNTIKYAVLNSQGSSANNVVTVTTEAIPVNTSFGQSGVTEFSGNITVIQSITLPDNQTYQFIYDQGSTGTHYGTLTGMTVPTGGPVSFTHEKFKDAYGNQYLYLSNCSAGGGTWSFVPQVITSCGTTCSQQVTVTQPSSDQEQYAFTMFNGQMWNTKRTYYTGSVASGTLLQTVTTDYNSSNPPYIQPIRVTTTVPIPGNLSLSKKVEVSYDSANLGNVMTSSEWGFYPGAYPGSFPSSPDRSTSYAYLANSDNNMVNKKTSVSVTSGLSQTITYDSYGSTGLKSVTSVIGHDDSFGTGYTARGNPTQITVSSTSPNITTNFTYDTTGQMLTSQDPNKNTTSYGYTDCYMTDGSIPATSYNSSAITNAFTTQITLPTSGSLGLCYYFYSGKLASMTDQNGATTSYHYIDSWDRQTHTIRPIGWTQLAYSANELELDSYVGINDPNPATNCSSCRHDATYFDSFGRFSYSQLLNDPDGSTTTAALTYDSRGRIHTSTNPYRSVSDSSYGVETPSYDGLQRITQIQHADGSVSRVYYGAQLSSSGFSGINTTQLCPVSSYFNGFPTLYVDETNELRETWTDGLGQTIEVDEPDSAGNLTSNTCYGYGVMNELASVAHTVGSTTQTRTNGIDGLSRVTSSVIPETGNQTAKYFYTNSAGSLCSGDSSQVCRTTDPRGTTTTYTYDSMNRLTGKSYSDNTTPSVTYTYDQNNCGTGSNALGRMTGISMGDSSSAALWCYDADGRPVTEKRTIAGVSKTISYSYAGDGTVSSITYPSGRQVSYSIGNAERALSATDSNGTQYAVSASYAATGWLSSDILGQVSGAGGTKQLLGYDNRLETCRIAATSTTSFSFQHACTDSIPSGSVFDFSLSYLDSSGHDNGLVRTVSNNVHSGRSQAFGYDKLSRIQSASTYATSGLACWGQSYTIDPLANLSDITPTQCTTGMLSASPNESTNQLTFVGTPPQPPSYDSAGNTTNDGSYTYTYDAENRIASAIGMTSGPYCYGYDGRGIRVKKSHGGTCSQPTSVDTLYWRSITGDVLAETDSTGNTVKNEYVYFAGQKIAWWDSVVPKNLYYTYSDILDTTRTIMQVINNIPTLCYDADFTPFGQEMQQSNTCPSTFDYKFTGYERDAETGLDYALARFYNSRLGRFMSIDPGGVAASVNNPQSFNGYSYVLNDPCDLIDPLGLTQCNFKVGIVNKVGLTGDQLAGIENQVNAILGQAADASGNTVGVTFTNSTEGVDTSISFQNGPWYYPSSYAGKTSCFPLLGCWGNPSVFVDNIRSNLPASLSADEVNRSIGGVAAHELYHRLSDSGSHSDDPSNLMTGEGSPSWNPPNGHTNDVLTQQQIAALFKKCMKPPPPPGSGTGGAGGGGTSGGGGGGVIVICGVLDYDTEKRKCVIFQ